MAKQYPDITDWNNLNKYADLFKTTESGGQGQLLDGDPSFVTNDEALVKNLNLNYKVVYAGSEAALIQAFRQAEANKKPLIGYFYDPQWFMSEVPLVKVNLPPYTEGCDADPAKIACDYPKYDLNKIVASQVRRGQQPGLQAGQGVQLDQRGPERGRQVHRRGQDGPGDRPRRSGSTPTRTRSTPGSRPPRPEHGRPRAAPVSEVLGHERRSPLDSRDVEDDRRVPNLFMDGKWTAGSGGTADVLNPFDASVVETVDQAGPDDVEAAVAAARAAFDDPRGWRATPVAERAGVAAPHRRPAPARQGAHRPRRDARHGQDARSRAASTSTT